MQLEDITYRWMAPIHRFEKKFFGGLLGATSFLAVGMVGIVTFGLLSQLITGLTGMVVAAVVTVIAMLLTLLVITPLPVFYDMTLPVYVWKRWQLTRKPETIRPTLQLLTRSTDSHQVAILDEDGAVIGEIQSHVNGYHD